MRKRIKKWFWWWHTKLRKWYIRKTRTVNAKGVYLCYYIINKYISCTTPDDQNDEHERPISATLERMHRLFAKTGIPERRKDAAIFTLGNVLSFASDDIRQKIFDYLNDERLKEQLEKYIKSGVIV